jgi:hypothetical protein
VLSLRCHIKLTIDVNFIHHQFCLSLVLLRFSESWVYFLSLFFYFGGGGCSLIQMLGPFSFLGARCHTSSLSLEKGKLGHYVSGFHTKFVRFSYPMNSLKGNVLRDFQFISKELLEDFFTILFSFNPYLPYLFHQEEQLIGALIYFRRFS